MRFVTPPQSFNVGREEKEAKLRTLISECLAGGQTSVNVVARAPDSPVARALAAIAAEPASHHVAIRAIFLDAETGTADDLQLLDLPNVETRMLRDARFASAHEQLDMGCDRAWLGDCMRRDPTKRDAFELHITGDAKAVHHAAVSFERLWLQATPANRVKTIAAEFVIAHQTGAALAAPADHGTSSSRR